MNAEKKPPSHPLSSSLQPGMEGEEANVDSDYGSGDDEDDGGDSDWDPLMGARAGRELQDEGGRGGEEERKDETVAGGRIKERGAADADERWRLVSMNTGRVVHPSWNVPANNTRRDRSYGVAGGGWTDEKPAASAQ